MSHKVYMSFLHYRGAWRVGFLQEDLKTPLRRRLNFLDSAKLVEMIECGGGFRNAEHRMHMDYAITLGRGGTYLNLTDEQYQKLC